MTFLILIHFLSFVVHNLQPVFLVTVDLSLLVDFNQIPLLVYVLLLRRVANHSKTVLVVEEGFSVLITHLVAAFIMRFSVYQLVSMFVVDVVLPIDDAHLLSQLVVAPMVAFFIDVHPIAVLVVADGIVIGVVLELVAVTVDLYWLPLAFGVQALIALGFLQMELRVVFFLASDLGQR